MGPFIEGVSSARGQLFRENDWDPLYDPLGWVYTKLETVGDFDGDGRADMVIKAQAALDEPVFQSVILEMPASGVYFEEADRWELTTTGTLYTSDVIPSTFMRFMGDSTGDGAEELLVVDDRVGAPGYEGEVYWLSIGDLL